MSSMKNHLIYLIHYLFLTILTLILPYFFVKHLIQLKLWAIIYLIWFILDFKKPENGSRLIPGLRKLSCWKLLSEYFPFELIKTKDLPSNRNYIFACHPHGLFSVVPLQFFTTDSGNFSEKFPGLTSYMVTLNQQFWLPLYREWLLLLGYCSSSAKSINYLLKLNPNGGTVVGLMVGGTQELLDSNPKTSSKEMILIVRRRLGFLRLALKNGASIVPVITFGEDNLYKIIQPQSGLFLKIQQFFKKIFGMPLILFYGRFGLFPMKQKCFTVVGEPIFIDECIVDPTKEQLENLQQKYIEALENLFNSYKNQFNYSDMKLVIK